MKISVFGLGYVGVVAAGCLAADGHEVIGVDPNVTKVKLINQGVSPIVEAEIGEMVAEFSSNGKLRATTDTADAIFGTDISFVCVGTPSQRTGGLDLSYVRKVCEEIGESLRIKDSFHLVVMRSTILPGTMGTLIIPTLEASSGKQAGIDFGVCNNPEFLREGTAVWDYRNPPKTVIGETDKRSGDILSSLYEELGAPLIRTEIEIAEMVKYVDNVWHAVKVAFANEVGSFCKELAVDSHRVMEIFCQDTKLNLSPYYLKPGFAFGGSCLPKDLRALTHKAKTLDLSMPLLYSVLDSNQEQIDRAYRKILESGAKRIGFLGFSFKAGTDDLRESPLVELIERLLGKGKALLLYDKNVSIAKLTGANKDYILNHVPHLSAIMVEDIDSVLNGSDLIIIGNGANEFVEPTEKAVAAGKPVIDLIRIKSTMSSGGSYEGIAW